MHHMNNLYSVTPHTRERSDEIKLLLNVANLSINGFKRLNIPISTCDQWLVHFLSTKISKETHQAWECHLGSSIQIPTFAEFETFLNNHVITIDAIENRNVSTHNRNGNLDKPNTSNNYAKRSSLQSVHRINHTNQNRSAFIHFPKTIIRILIIVFIVERRRRTTQFVGVHYF